MTDKTSKNANFANLEHRLGREVPTDFAQLRNCMSPALERAAALADLMEVAFEDTEVVDNVSGSLWRIAQSVRLEINDAQAMLEAYVNRQVSPHEQADIACSSGKVRMNNRLEIVDGGKS